MKNEIQKLVKDTRKLCRFLFKVDGKPAEIAPFQEEIISAMMWKKHKRLIIWCSTQAGKSRATAMGLLLMAIIYPNERIVNISATNRQAMIMFDYIKEHIFDHSWITDSLTKFSMTTRDKFLSKLNRDKISFSEDTTISILSAEAGVPAGEGILGHTATILVVDESPSIRDDIYRTKVITRLGAKRDSSKMLIELGCVAPSTMILSDRLKPIGHGQIGYSKTSESIFGIGGFNHATHRFSHPKTKTLILITEKGYSLEATPNHKIYAHKDGQFQWVRMDNLERGDFTALLSNTEIYPKDPTLKDFDFPLRTNTKDTNCELSEDMCYLLGLYLSEGTLSNNRLTITNSENEIRSFLREKFNFKTRDRYHMRLSSRKLVAFMKHLGFQPATRAPNKTVPDSIMGLPKAKLISFLQGYFDGDGCAQDDNIQAASTSENLLKRLQIILLNYGIMSTIFPRITKPRYFEGRTFQGQGVIYILLMSRYDAMKFQEKIGFRLQRKNQRFQHSRSETRDLRQVPLNWKLMKRKRQVKTGWHTLKRNKETVSRHTVSKFLQDYDSPEYQFIIDNNLLFDRVKSIKPSSSEVSDFVIPSTRSYFSNGFVSHNTAFSRNHFFDSWNDPDYHRIQVDWKRAVAENRLDYDFVMKQKDSMTPVEFAIWYECRLPEMLPNQFANWEWIQKAKAPQNLGTISGKRILGVDPATTGTDVAVLTSVIKGEYSAVVETKKFNNCSTMDLVSEIEKLDQKRNHSIINIDKTGLGEGVVDRAQELQALKPKVQGLHSHQAPSTEDNKKRFQNLKAEIYFNLRAMLEGGRIHIENDQKLIEQLANTFITHSQTYKTGVKYTGHGSADELDSLSLACYEPITTKQIFWKPIAR